MSGSSLARSKQAPLDISEDRSKIRTCVRTGLITASALLVSVEKTP